MVQVNGQVNAELCGRLSSSSSPAETRTTDPTPSTQLRGDSTVSLASWVGNLAAEDCGWCARATIALLCRSLHRNAVGVFHLPPLTLR